jgi:hypothetical protein
MGAPGHNQAQGAVRTETSQGVRRKDEDPRLGG